MPTDDFYIYVIFRRDGSPCYVGKGRRRRWLIHAKNTHNQRLARIFAKAGGDLPVIKIRENLSELQAFEIEIALIAAIGRGKYGPLVNLTDGGEGSSGFAYVDSPERRAKIAIKSMGNTAHLGMTHSAETKDVLRQKSTGNQNARGYKHSDASRAQMRSRRAKQESPSAGTRAKISAALHGHKCSIETRLKISVVKRERNRLKMEAHA